jgi:hypothetical protein
MRQQRACRVAGRATSGSILVLVIGLALGGCIARDSVPFLDTDPAGPVEAPDRPGVVHTIRWSGETLGTIARWYTGSASRWRAIARANPDLEPERLRIDDEVLIPEDLAVRRAPMPRRVLEAPPPSSPASGTDPAEATDSGDTPDTSGEASTEPGEASARPPTPTPAEEAPDDPDPDSDSDAASRAPDTEGGEPDDGTAPELFGPRGL